jgi:hypothetical protein
VGCSWSALKCFARPRWRVAGSWQLAAGSGAHCWWQIAGSGSTCTRKPAFQSNVQQSNGNALVRRTLRSRWWGRRSRSGIQSSCSSAQHTPRSCLQVQARQRQLERRRKCSPRPSTQTTSWGQTRRCGWWSQTLCNGQTQRKHQHLHGSQAQSHTMITHTKKQAALTSSVQPQCRENNPGSCAGS